MSNTSSGYRYGYSKIDDTGSKDLLKSAKKKIKKFFKKLWKSFKIWFFVILGMIVIITIAAIVIGAKSGNKSSVSSYQKSSVTVDGVKYEAVVKDGKKRCFKNDEEINCDELPENVTATNEFSCTINGEKRNYEDCSKYT